MSKTRKDLKCPVFGDLTKLSDNMLPTYCDVIKHYLWIGNDMLELNNGKDPSVKNLCEMIATNIEQILNNHPFRPSTSRCKGSKETKESVCSPSTSSTQMTVSTSGSSLTDILGEDEIRIIETPRRSGKETQQMRAHRKTITEEHIFLLSEPDSVISLLILEKQITIEKSIVDFLEMKFEFRSSLVAIGCDGTAVNTGHKNGVIVLLEKHLKRPLQGFVCLLHANELPFRHLFSSLDELPDLNTDLLSTDQKYLSDVLRKFYWYEYILLAILQDDAEHIRELALQRILKAKKEKKVREFKLPELKIDASSYYVLIDWAVEKITEPPLTMKYSDIEISNDISSKCLLEIEKYPCHTQAVERCVKLVTEASISVCGPEARDGFIRTRIKARQDIQIFNTKFQYFGKKEGAEILELRH
ncbi:hypothetical protein HELRODRAFT_181119 [Helobdella robusta]|uniref:Uncharacterized protein n=1 Tax=Helobdella robusta TaxID=6412 RepID=T1FGM7_HELRO|nr:hypothetical protein HELRODRAFT_181119 [Helobdella robusta]ESN93198.1 hypothetical protein HELRODRAFT_181119 [Helobdella robusta]